VARAQNIITGISFASLLSLAPISAQTERPGERAPERGRAVAQPQGTEAQQGGQRVDAAPTSTRNLVRASELLGKDIKNREGKDMGDISELALDLRSGRAAYAIISFGGFLGIGDKLVAVPFQVLQPSADGKYMVLDVPKEKLEKAPRFDKKEWPDMDDEKWGREIHTFYGVEPYWTAQLGMPVRDVTGREAVAREGNIAARDRVGGEDASAMKDKFDRNTVTTVVGKVVSIDRPLGTAVGAEKTGRDTTGRTTDAGMGLVQITLRTEGANPDDKGDNQTGRTAGGNTIKVLLGPSTFLDTQHLNLAANDQVTVKGSKIDKDGQQCVIATEIRKLDQVVRLRDENGNSLWAGGQAATPPTGGRK